MKKSLLVLLPFLFALCFVSCNNDDDSSSDEIEDREEQAIIDDAIVEEFLKGYTYNKEDFENDNTLTDQDIVFSRLEEGSTGSSLWDLKSEYTYTYEDEDEEEITQTYYVITVREGEGKEIYEADRVELTYQTKIILTDYEDDSDARLLETNKTNLDSLTTRAQFSSIGFINGFNQALTKFKTATLTNEDDTCSTFNIGEDGSVTTNNDFGIGIVVMPSGLGYFDGDLYFNNQEDDDDDDESDDVEEEDSFGYRNLILTFSTYNAVDQDLDSDGIPSLLEDLNGNGDFDDDDTDGDEIPDYLDSDDDDDDILTFFEIYSRDLYFDIDEDCDGTFTNDGNLTFIYPNTSSALYEELVGDDVLILADPEKSTTNNGTPYHLDADVEFDKQVIFDEDSYSEEEFESNDFSIIVGSKEY